MTVNEKIPVWFDCDPGTDDAFGLLLALLNKHFQVVGITSVHGNATVENTTVNILTILDKLGKSQVPVYKGAARPLEREPVHAGYIHGDSGLGVTDVPKTHTAKLSTDKPYLEAMYDAIKEHQNIVLICTGTLTNVAQLVSKYPDVVERVRYVSAMGGSFGFGNISPFAEFNFFADPEAAKDVVEAFGNKIVLSPLNITHTALATIEVRDEIKKRLPFFSSIIEFSYKTNLEYGGKTYGPPVHDPVAVYVLLALVTDEEYGVEWRDVAIDVCIKGERSGETTEKNNGTLIEKAKVAVKLDTNKFWSMIMADLDVVG